MGSIKLTIKVDSVHRVRQYILFRRPFGVELTSFGAVTKYIHLRASTENFPGRATKKKTKISKNIEK